MLDPEFCREWHRLDWSFLINGKLASLLFLVSRTAHALACRILDVYPVEYEDGMEQPE